MLNVVQGREYLGDALLAGRIAYTWSALSRACHYHPYELPPSMSELADHFATVEELIDRVGTI